MKIDTTDLIDTNEVAELVGLTNPKGVSVYQRRDGLDFPQPVIAKGGCRLWLRSEVKAWADARKGQQ